MHMKSTLAAVVAAAVMMFAVPQAASALPEVSGAKQLNTSSVEKTGYRGYRRGYYRRHGYYGRRHYRRRPGFGIYLGF